MKKNKIWGLLCVLIIVFMLVGCSSETKTIINTPSGEPDIIELQPNRKLVTVTYNPGGGAFGVLTRDMGVDEMAESYYYESYYYNAITPGHTGITIIETKE